MRHMNEPEALPKWTEKETAEERATLGLAVREMREKRRYRQSHLARAIGVSQKTLWNIEAGTAWPSMKVYIALVRVLHAGKIPLVK